MVPAEICSYIETYFPQWKQHKEQVQSFSMIGGGCIHRSYRVDTQQGSYFLKWNDIREAHNLQVEAKGMHLLKEKSLFDIPNVLFQGEAAEKYTFLLLSFVESGIPKRQYWEEFGERLARLHLITTAQFGLPYDNYIGRLPQSNTQYANWADFFVLERLEPMIRMARNAQYLDRYIAREFERLYSRIESLCPKEAPALLHGDLWSGNILTTSKGEATLIDPAVYFGHREMDIAFSTLFDSFPTRFYESYNRVYPMELNWEERLDLYNLYPLLVHVNLFGQGYIASVKRTLKQYL